MLSIDSLVFFWFYNYCPGRINISDFVSVLMINNRILIPRSYSSCSINTVLKYAVNGKYWIQKRYIISHSIDAPYSLVYATTPMSFDRISLKPLSKMKEYTGIAKPPPTTLARFSAKPPTSEYGKSVIFNKPAVALREHRYLMKKATWDR